MLTPVRPGRQLCHVRATDITASGIAAGLSAIRSEREMKPQRIVKIGEFLRRGSAESTYEALRGDRSDLLGLRFGVHDEATGGW